MSFGAKAGQIASCVSGIRRVQLPIVRRGIPSRGRRGALLEREAGQSAFVQDGLGLGPELAEIALDHRPDDVEVDVK
jgi:hypothetical protein